MEKSCSLNTTQELENLLGRKYFYRQSIYRMAEDGKINTYQVNKTRYFSKDEVIQAALQRLSDSISRRHPWIPPDTIRIRFDEKESKKIIIYGFSKSEEIVSDTEKETEEELLAKIETIREEVKSMPDVPVKPHHEPHEEPPPPPRGPHHGRHHRPHHEPPHHVEILEALRRIEDRLTRLEEKLG